MTKSEYCVLGKTDDKISLPLLINSNLKENIDSNNNNNNRKYNQ